jgi:hypothetical protein
VVIELVELNNKKLKTRNQKLFLRHEATLNPLTFKRERGGRVFVRNREPWFKSIPIAERTPEFELLGKSWDLKP